MTWFDLPPSDARAAITEWLSDRGEPAYRVRQLHPRLWQQPIAAWADATDLPRPLVATLDVEQPIPRPTRAAERRSRDGTVKFLWRFADGTAVESVLIPEGKRRTLCISSQAGCAFGCLFCATGRMGFERHLGAAEIAMQVREMMLDPGVGRPTNVVFMGMGEPLHNWQAVGTALSILNHASGCRIGARHITVSTVGLVPGLKQLAQRPEQFRVAWSLHAATSETRVGLMPVERKYPLDLVVEALKAFPRRVTLEYVLIAGRNDRPHDADALARIARELGALINLLPLHPGGAPGLRPTPAAAIEEFATRLGARGAQVTVRRSRGLDIEAACGQLRIGQEQHRIGSQQYRDVEQQPQVGLDNDATESKDVPHRTSHS